MLTAADCSNLRRKAAIFVACLVEVKLLELNAETTITVADNGVVMS